MSALCLHLNLSFSLPVLQNFNSCVKLVKYLLYSEDSLLDVRHFSNMKEKCRAASTVEED